MIRLTPLLVFAFASVSCITPPPMDDQPSPSPGQGDTTISAPPRQDDPVPVPPPVAPVPRSERPFATQEAGLGFGRDSAWIQSRTNVGRNSLIDAGLYFTDHETIFNIGILQIGRPKPESPLALGAGVSFYGGTLRNPLDDFSAVALSGIAKYRIEAMLPGTLMAEVSYAPEALAFGDADSLIDAKFTFEIELASTAAILIGYRWYEVGITDNFNLKLEDSVIIGVRLGF